jgi:hypothetical protein
MNRILTIAGCLMLVFFTVVCGGLGLLYLIGG